MVTIRSMALTKAKETITFPHCHLVQDVQLEIFLEQRFLLQRVADSVYGTLAAGRQIKVGHLIMIPLYLD